MEKKRFVFIAHWVENWNWLLWWINDLHRNPRHAWRWIWLWPACAIASLVYLFGKKSYDEVDSFGFNGKLQGKTFLTRNFGWHFMLLLIPVAKWNPRIGLFVRLKQRLQIQQLKLFALLRTRVLETVKAAQDEADVIGLGALTKAEWLTAGGKWIVDTLGDKLRVPIVHGDTLTAAAVIKMALRLIEQKRINSPVFITGATSKIGRAVVLDLAARGVEVMMYTDSPKRFEAICAEAGECSRNIQKAASLSDGLDSQLWITGKALPVGKKLMKYIPEGATVVNFSVPNPVPEYLFKKRPDLDFLEGGLLAYDSARTDLAFTMRLRPGITYACHAGLMVHAYKGWTHHEVSQVEMSQLLSVWEAAEELGFFLPKEERVAEAKGRVTIPKLVLQKVGKLLF